MTRRLVARLGSLGEVVLAGPAVRAVAASGEPVTFLASSSGAPAARLLPGVERVLTFDAAWVAFDAPDVDRAAVEALIDEVTRAGIEEAVILTSFHQSPLPLALLLRLAGVPHITATSLDYAGRLVDARQPYIDELHEVEQALATAGAAGHRLPQGDDGRLAIQLGLRAVPKRERAASVPYVVVHPGASVHARALPIDVAAEIVEQLAAREQHVVVSGTSSERRLVRRVTGDAPDEFVTACAGGTDLDQFARLLAGAQAVVCGNTGPAHIAAAVGTPIVEAFAPVEPAHRWRPWQVPHVLLGRLDIECAGCCARRCPLVDQPCLEPFRADVVLDALDRLTDAPAVLATGEGGASA
ncbi:MAG: glycosyltransferase family 9 protein [Planctomycetota bacterium]